MSELRALAIDIDGTLIDSRKQIMPFTASEIHRVVEEHDAHLILVTARSPQSTAVIEERLGIPASYATFGGSLVEAREPDGRFTQLKAVPLLDDDVRKMLEVASTFDVHTGVYTRDVWHVNSLEYWGMREARNTSVWPVVDEVERVVGSSPLFKVMFRGEAEPLNELADALGALGTSTYAHHLKNMIEVVASGAVKLPALEALTRHLGIGLEQVIAFGDTSADLDMLAGVGVGYLMGNASSALTVPAGVRRALSHDEEGIGVALRKHFPSDAPFRT
ncbi:HAD hydrolase family protein [Parafrigoribacterium soli]|uniref:HAD hydrolase family protein n=1 Tax=Parafrigoribacterium soli TaxID=3144663 RepID=UPI0032EE16D8